jgi:hypothetical protein
MPLWRMSKRRPTDATPGRPCGCDGEALAGSCEPIAYWGLSGAKWFLRMLAAASRTLGLGAARPAWIRVEWGARLHLSPSLTSPSASLLANCAIRVLAGFNAVSPEATSSWKRSPDRRLWWHRTRSSRGLPAQEVARKGEDPGEFEFLPGPGRGGGRRLFLAPPRRLLLLGPIITGLVVVFSGVVEGCGGRAEGFRLRGGYPYRIL